MAYDVEFKDTADVAWKDTDDVVWARAVIFFNGIINFLTKPIKWVFTSLSR